MRYPDLWSGETEWRREMIYPPSLEVGDKIAILSPSSPVKEEFIDGACEFLKSQGYRAEVMSYAKGPASGSYASELKFRFDDFLRAWEDNSIKAILCSRGGYGAVHLLRHIDPYRLRRAPKWLIGYSDISALHAVLLRAGIASIHAPMAKHLTDEGMDVSTQYLMRILKGDFPITYRVATNLNNRVGEAVGELVGGNLAVLNGLGGTGFDVVRNDTILFIEDISEAIYAVERMLYRLLLSGGFDRVKGLIVGRFTEYKPDKNYTTMETMISDFLEREGIRDIPVAFDFPVGHVKENYPLVEGANVCFRVNEYGVELVMMK